MPVTSLHQRPRKMNHRPPIISPQSNPQGYSQTPQTSADAVDELPSPAPFPFFKLPAELRNSIYHLVVTTGQTLIIRDMHPEELEESQKKGTYRSRSSYLATDHSCRLELSTGGMLALSNPLCAMYYTGPRPVMISYTLGIRKSINTTTLALLSLDKQSREEVASIFYGENIFHFVTISSLVPFMKNRTAQSRKYIQVLRLTLTIDERNWYAAFTEHGRPATWNTAFSSLLKMPHVNIKKVCIEIDDTRVKLLIDGLDLGSRSMLWLHKLSRINNLEMLGLTYNVGSWKEICELQPNLSGLLSQSGFTSEQLLFLQAIIEKRVAAAIEAGFGQEEVNTQTQQELWKFLAPKMLKKEADDHSPDALQHRRIW